MSPLLLILPVTAPRYADASLRFAAAMLVELPYCCCYAPLRLPLLIDASALSRAYYDAA